ncbi:amidase [Pseudooceanicola nanhaiensis]|uniref:amidase n=1 Tax=Pseudooceanicola nanhaiensis TaxID=375761 RepID=UPI001CD65D9A|nr:amidase [Pseudooceanicola nanhaiensis]MCA0921274.1 amidase [Pseudooceanicola nanhaiensis]
MDGIDYDRMDGTDMAEAVRTGRVAPDTFVVEAIRRAKAVNGQLNAMVHDIAPVMPASLDGAFAGVPLPLKNIGVSVKDAPISSGAAIFKDVVSPADNTMAKRYREAGLVFIGRTNTPELALSFTSEPALHGPACNPWDLTRTPGGSSGGSAALVAAGVVPLAQSSDGAGSTRVPSAHCGVFGFKPSRIRNPVGPATAEGIAGMSTPHAISRTVRDNARLLDVSSGPDVGDPYAAPAPLRPYAQEVGRDPGKLRIGLVTEGPAGAPLDPVCVAAAREVADLCRALGHEVIETSDPYDNAALKQAWRVISGVSVARGIDGYAAANRIADPDALLEPVNALWVQEGRTISGGDYLGAVQALHTTSRAMGGFFEGFDIYMSPTTAELAPKLGKLAGAGKDLDTFYDLFWQHAPLTAVFNASGCPAMNVPLVWHEGLPVGVQFGAAFGADGLLFALAAQLEAAAPWAQRRPSVWAGAEAMA